MGSATMFGNVAETRSDAKSIGFLIPMTYPSAVAAKKEMERTPKADTIMNQYDPIDEAVTDCAIVLYISERTSTWKPNLATTPTDLDGKRGFRRGTDELLVRRVLLHVLSLTSKLHLQCTAHAPTAPIT